MRTRPAPLSSTMEFTRHCPETGDEVDVEVSLHGTWCPGERGSYYDPPVPAGVEAVYATANGRPFPLSRREADWAAECLADMAEES